MAEMIGKFKEEDIRKAYFSRKLPEFLVKIQANQEVSTDELAKLTDFLDKLRKQEENLLNSIQGYIIDHNEEDNLAKELAGQEINSQEIAEEKTKREKAVKVADQLMRSIANRYINEKLQDPDKEELMEIAFELVGLRYYIDEEAVISEQLYKQKIIQYEAAGKQRKTAEEYAKVTPEYRQYKKFYDLKERIKSFENNARRTNNTYT